MYLCVCVCACVYVRLCMYLRYLFCVVLKIKMGKLQFFLNISFPIDFQQKPTGKLYKSRDNEFRFKIFNYLIIKFNIV